MNRMLNTTEYMALFFQLPLPFQSIPIHFGTILCVFCAAKFVFHHKNPFSVMSALRYLQQDLYVVFVGTQIYRIAIETGADGMCVFIEVWTNETCVYKS